MQSLQLVSLKIYPLITKSCQIKPILMGINQSVSHSAVSDSFAASWTIARQAPFCPWHSPGKNTGLSSYSLLQEIFPTQGSNLSLLHCRLILYHWATRETIPSLWRLFAQGSWFTDGKGRNVEEWVGKIKTNLHPSCSFLLLLSVLGISASWLGGLIGLPGKS